MSLFWDLLLLSLSEFHCKNLVISCTTYSGAIASSMTLIINKLFALCWYLYIILLIQWNGSLPFFLKKKKKALMQVFQVANKRDSYLRCYHIYTCTIWISIRYPNAYWINYILIFLQQIVTKKLLELRFLSSGRILICHKRCFYPLWLTRHKSESLMFHSLYLI